MQSYLERYVHPHIYLYSDGAMEIFKVHVAIGKIGFIQQQKNTPLKRASVFDTVQEHS